MGGYSCLADFNFYDELLAKTLIPTYILVPIFVKILCKQKWLKVGRRKRWRTTWTR